MRKRSSIKSKQGLDLSSSNSMHPVHEKANMHFNPHSSFSNAKLRKQSIKQNNDIVKLASIIEDWKTIDLENMHQIYLFTLVIMYAPKKNWKKTASFIRSCIEECYGNAISHDEIKANMTPERSETPRLTMFIERPILDKTEEWYKENNINLVLYRRAIIAIPKFITNKENFIDSFTMYENHNSKDQINLSGVSFEEIPKSISNPSGYIGANCNLENMSTPFFLDLSTKFSDRL